MTLFSGIGTEADSLTSCGGLEPRPPQRDFFKFMQKDREGFDSHILRFSARLVIDGKVDVKRKFVVAYFLSDDNILVTLVPEENSGTWLTIVYMRNPTISYNQLKDRQSTIFYCILAVCCL